MSRVRSLQSFFHGSSITEYVWRLSENYEDEHFAQIGRLFVSTGVFFSPKVWAGVSLTLHFYALLFLLLLVRMLFFFSTSIGFCNFLKACNVLIFLCTWFSSLPYLVFITRFINGLLEF